MAQIDPYIGVNMQAQWLANQRAQQQLQSQNTLRQIMSQPGAISDTGQISPNTLQQMLRADPMTTLGILQQQAQLADQTSMRRYRDAEANRAQRQDTLSGMSEALAAYDDTMSNAGANPQIAQQKLMQSIHDDIYASGASPQDKDRQWAQVSQLSPGGIRNLVTVGQLGAAQVEKGRERQQATMEGPDGPVPVTTDAYGNVYDESGQLRDSWSLSA